MNNETDKQNIKKKQEEIQFVKKKKQLNLKTKKMVSGIVEKIFSTLISLNRYNRGMIGQRKISFNEFFKFILFLCPIKFIS